MIQKKFKFFNIHKFDVSFYTFRFNNKPINPSDISAYFIINTELQVQYIARIFALLKNNKYFCIESEVCCTMKYGNLIKERRTLLGLTQQDLSDYTGLSVRIIKSIEAQQGNPSLNTLERIAEILGLEIVMKVKIINE